MNYKIRWGNTHSTIFQTLVKELNVAKIKYFILRNYEGLPTTNPSKDVDIIIEPGSYSQTSLILKSIFQTYNLHHKVVKYEKVRCWYGMNIKNNFSIHIDLIEGYLNKGFELFPFETLYTHTLSYKDFRVLNPEYDAAMLLYYKLIGTGELKDTYRSKIDLVIHNQENQISDLIKKTSGRSYGGKIIKRLKEDDFDKIQEDAGKLRRITRVKAFLRNPFKTSINIIRFSIDKFERIIICPRRFHNSLAILGPDGTGKSTFIEGLTEATGYYFNADENKSQIYHHRPTVLPNLGAVGEKAGVMKEDKDFTNPHRRKPASRFSSFVRMAYYWLDYLVGMPILLRKDVKFDRFTIFDRYIYDFLIDPKRSRINLPYWLRKLFTQMVIQPRIVFVLSTDAQTIFNRKQELSLEEIERQLGEFSKLAKSHKRFHVLDASKTPEQIVNDAMKIIMNEFTEKL